MNYEIARTIILSIGWPMLIMGSIFVMHRAYQFYTKTGKTPIGKLIPLFALASIITAYALGFVATAFMYLDVIHGVLYVTPIFFIWFIIMVATILVSLRLNKEAYVYNRAVTLFNKSKDNFIAIVAHQLRTPLSGIKWTLDLLTQEKDLSEVAKKKIEQMNNENDKMIRIISDLLSITQLENNKITVRSEKIDIAHLLSDIITTLTPHAEKNNQSISYTKKDTQMNAYTVEVDTLLVGEAIKNIISNAINHGAHNNDIHIELFEDSTDNGKHNEKYICISVHNFGEKIPEARLKNMFEKFSRNNDDHEELVQEIGGLGLFIARSFMRLVKGDISVTSSEEHGTLFTIRLHK